MTVEILRPLARSEFATGFWFGLIALAVGLALAFPRRGRRPIDAAGLLFSVAFALALQQTLGLPGALALGLVGLAGAGAISRLPMLGRLGPILAVPGAWLVVSGCGLVLERWTWMLAGVAIVIGGWLLADFDARWQREDLGPVLLAISMAGIYFTVPDTEHALVALGASLPLAFLGWPWPLASLGRAGAYAATGSLLWIVVTGGFGRSSAVVGGVACLGLFAVEPVTRLLDRGGRSMLECLPRGRRGAVIVAFLHLALVYIAARVAGTRRTVAEAAAIALAEFAAAVVLSLIATAVGFRRAARPQAGASP